MSKKNTRGTEYQKPNGYPLPTRTVLYSRKKHIQPIPEVGKRYHCFDDGKITFSRHYIVEVSRVIGYMEFKRDYPELFKSYLEESKRCYWLYSRRSDKFVICDEGEDGNPEVFVRTKQGGWFSIGDFFNSGRLDVTGRLWENLLKWIDDFDYTEEEKEEIIREGTI